MGASGSIHGIADLPVLDEDPGFEQGVELPNVEKPIAEPSIE